MTPWNKGKKMPHSKEWEAKRLSAVRDSAKRRVHPKGYKRPVEHTQPMRAALKQQRQSDPKRFRDLSIANLPKNVAKENNPNWRGGKTALKRDFATANSNKIKKWRAAVFERDGFKCKDCGATGGLQAHHIVPLVKTTAFAFDRANGVTLCVSCHKKTDSYAAKGRRLKPVGHSILLMTIPHRWQDYDTVGNWRIGTDGSILILASELGNEDYEFLILLHELIETFLCKRRGITAEAVDAFDMRFERDRSEGNVDEPGDNPAAPYYSEHQFASIIERFMAHELGVDWDEYDHAVSKL